MIALRRWLWLWLLGVPVLALAAWGIADNARLFFITVLNSLTLAALYFLVASGFTLVFGLLRNVNLAHGSLYLIGAYVGWQVGHHAEAGLLNIESWFLAAESRFLATQSWFLATASWFLAVVAGFLFALVIGLVLQVGVFRYMHGQDLRQTMATIALSIIAADIALWIWGGEIYTFDPPRWITGSTTLPIVGKFATFRLVLLAAAIVIGFVLWWFLARTRIGMMIRAGVDDRGMLAASGVNVQVVFAVTFAIGAGLAGFAGVVGATTYSIAPGEDTRFLLASLVVVIVGGMGSVTGAALGAVLVGAAEQFGLAYAPTYGVVFTFIIMAIVLAFRPQGILGRRA